MLQISTDRAIRDYFPQKSFWQIYFEAVHNAADAGATTVTIQVSSDGQVKDPQFDVEISDNGLGFQDDDFQRFAAIRDPKDPDHKGLGRLIYLAYFERVRVESVYEKGAKKLCRTFTFSRDWSANSKVVSVDPETPTGTKLSFRGFRMSKLAAAKYIRPGDVKQQIRDHFYPLFQTFRRSGRQFDIDIILKTDQNKQLNLVSDSQSFSPSDLPELKSIVVKDQNLDLHADITVWYEIQANCAISGVKSIASVDGRTVSLPLLQPSAVPTGSYAFFLLESPLFTGMSDNARERLVLSADLTIDRLKAAVGPTLNKLLSKSIPAIQTKNQRTKEQFNHQYPHLSGYLDYSSIGLIDKEETIRSGQAQFFLDQREVLEAGDLDEESFQKALDVSARSLTEYILYREQVIRRLEATPPSAREKVVHDLFSPQREVFDSERMFEEIYRNNAWILDDKFMTFRTILSEQDMEVVTRQITLDSEVVDKGRPDITLIFSADPNAGQKVDVVVVELKKRKVDDKEGTYAAIQLLKRARLLVDHCPNIQRVWYYGVIEMDASIEQLLVDDGWIELFSKDKVLHRTRTIRRTSDQALVPCPFFLLSFDAVIEDAAARNHAFLELLRGRLRALQEPVEAEELKVAEPNVG